MFGCQPTPATPRTPPPRNSVFRGGRNARRELWRDAQRCGSFWRGTKQALSFITVTMMGRAPSLVHLGDSTSMPFTRTAGKPGGSHCAAASSLQMHSSTAPQTEIWTCR